MGLKRTHWAIITVVFLLFSCGSTPPAETPPEADIPGNNLQTEAVFDPEHVSEEMYRTTLEEVRQFIEQLNSIISSRNYNSWVDMLSPAYYAEISSQEFLAGLSERLPGAPLRTAQDYFTRIVVPSRRTSRLDDIEFLDADKVTAFSISIRGDEERREILYNLVKINDMWKITN